MPVSRRATGTGGARGALDHGDVAVCRVPGPRAAPEKRNGCRADADGAADLQARDAYLAYRRDGGERDTHGGKWAAEIAHLLLAVETTTANARLAQLAGLPDPPAWLPPFVTALQAVVAGERSASLADAPGLDYSLSAEILLLLDRLAAAGR